MVGQNKLEHAHSIKMYGLFEERQVEGALSRLVSFSQWAISLVCIGCWPLLLYAREDLAGDSRQENAREQLAAEFTILHDMESLL